MIGIVFHQMGTIVGDCEETLDGCVEITNPVILIQSRNNVHHYPFLNITTDKKIVIQKSDVRFGKIFEPADEIRNHYSSHYGSGIQLA